MIRELKYTTLSHTATGARAAKTLRKIYARKTCVSEEDKGRKVEMPVTSKRRTDDDEHDTADDAAAAADADAAV